MKKRIWTMTDICTVNQKVDFGEPVTIEQAIEMWMNEEYNDILDVEIEQINEFREAN